MALRRASVLLKLAEVHVDPKATSLAIHASAGYRGRSGPSLTLGSFSWSTSRFDAQHGIATLAFTFSDRPDSSPSPLLPSLHRLPAPLAVCPPLVQLGQQRGAAVSRLFSSQAQKIKDKEKEDAAACDVAVHNYQELRGRLDKLEKPSSMRPWYLVGGDIVRAAGKVTLAVGKFVISIPSYVNAYRNMSKEDWAAKKSGWWATAKHEAQHYKVGTQLLWLELKISSRLALKSARGKHLSRRERKQLTRTTADMLRLVPMVVILLIPFLEFALPLLLRIFPNMLPSTYEDKLKKEEALKRRLAVRLELARFLQDTVAEMAKDISSRKGGEKSVTAKELLNFVKKVRAGEQVANSELVRFAKLFNDELTLDNLERVQLVSMCQFVGIAPFGTDGFLRNRLRSHLSQIKKDDYDIETEGLENLTEEELRAACRSRGMRAPFGEGAVAFMRAKMQDWLDLSLHRGLPSSLLLLSRAFTITATDKDVTTKKDKQYERVKETIGVIPEQLVDTLSYETLQGATDPLEALQKKLEVLKREEWLIKEELSRAAAAAAAVKSGAAFAVKVGVDLATASGAAAAAAATDSPEVKAAVAAATLSSKLEQHEPEDKVSMSSSEEERAEAAAAERERRIKTTIEALIDLSSSSAVAKERRTFLQLMKTEIERANKDLAKRSSARSLVFSEGVLENRSHSDSVWLAEGGSGDSREAKEAKEKETKLSDLQNKLGDRVSKMLAGIEKDLDEVETKIGSTMHLLDKDNDGVISHQELEDAIVFVKERLTQEELDVLLDRLSGNAAADTIAKFGGGEPREVSRIHIK